MHRQQLYALVDVDAMYASCEQVLQPWLRDRPLVVLSNGDGCVIARSAPAKTLGIEMGQPWFTIARDPRLHEVVARSANFPLYGDFSARLLAIVDRYSAVVEPYSIDESYLCLPAQTAAEQAHRLQQQVGDWLGLPVSIGLGPSRTLAHLATKHAKATPNSGGVCELSIAGEQHRQALLARTPVEALWGIADRLTTRLRGWGITTAADLAAADAGWARRAISVNVERTIRELRGIPCLPLEQAPPPRQQILHSRHLGHPVTDQETLAEIAATFAHTVARRLRRHHRTATSLSVHLSTGHYTAGPRTSVQTTQALPSPTAARSTLASTATELARRLWKPGYAYRRVGLLATDLTTWPAPQPLLTETTAVQDEALDAAMEQITDRYGTNSIGLGRAGLRTTPWWAAQQHHLWPISTTRWDRLPLVHC